MQNKLKVLVVDDAAFMRKAITEILKSDIRIEFVASARNGLDALDKIKDFHPDVITLDMDMPVMDGLTAIKHIMIKSPLPIVVLSSFFTDGAITFDALRLGVMDFVPKPSGAVSADIEKSKHQIINRIMLAHDMNLENVRRVRLPKKVNPKERLIDLYRYRPLTHVIAIGSTITGPNTVIRILSGLSPTLPAAVVVVQEISPKIISSFVKEFGEHTPWKVDVAEDGLVLEQGTCYIGSDETSLSLQVNAGEEISLKCSDRMDYPLNLLFSSAADVFQQNTIGILLTGTGDDGAAGFVKIKEASGVTIAQDTHCCIYPNLTDNAIQRGAVDMVIDEVRLCDTIEGLIA